MGMMLGEQRGQAVVDYPHLTDWYFKQRLDDYTRHWLNGVLDADWYWFRFEYQSRGSIHAHGCAKLKNDPNITLLKQKAAQGWLHRTENREDMLGEENDFLFAFVVDGGREAESHLIRYANWLVTTVNEDLPDAEWRFPEVHPSSVRPNVVENRDDDYHRLVNTVERHTRCSPAYCLKKKSAEAIAECRFGFPKSIVEETRLSYEKLPNNTVGTELETKRNDHRLNSHNRVMLENWRANVDLQVIIEENACARYMAKYAAKGEPRSKSAAEILKSCVSKLQDNDRVSSAIKKAVIQVAGDRDMAAQETAHMLLGLPLVGCTFSFVTVSLDNSRKVNVDNNEDQGDEVLQKSVLEEYGKRSANENNYHGLSQLNLVQYVSRYRQVNSKLMERSFPCIVRTFPKVSPNPGAPTFGRYCKYQLIKFKPWVNTPENAWNKAEETDEMFVSMYKEFLATDYAYENVLGCSKDDERVDRWLFGIPSENPDVNENDDDENYERAPEEAEEWMLLCRLNQSYAEESGNSILLDNTTDWFEDARSMPADVLRDSAGWIYKQRKEAEDNGTNNHVSDARRSMPTIDVSTLNEKQRHAYDIVVSHAESEETVKPVFMIVCGTAGTGKTYLIHAIKQALGDKCIVTATTGIAAFSIDGQTVHSAVQLPIHEYREIQGESLQRLQLKLEGKRYLIIDEMSMIGQRVLSWLDNRLRCGTGNQDKPFGGISVILLGDFGQLPPVGDRPMYVASSGSRAGEHGHMLYQLFDSVVILDQIMRQAGESNEAQEFRSLLMIMRDGEVTEQDWKLLLQHSTANVDMSQFNNAIRLFFDRKSVADYNYEKLRENRNPVAKINAKHSGNGAAEARSDEAGGLEAVLFLSKKAEVMMTCNLWAEVGLCNGSFGVVEKFWFAETQGPPNLPICIIVHFAGYRGPPCFSDCDKCVPVPPRVCDWMDNGRHLSRQQIPLRLRYAMTIHKSQGQTLTQAVVDLGKSEKVAGCTFVATSRVRSIDNIVFEPMTKEKLRQ